jgi:hypothetical protein
MAMVKKGGSIANKQKDLEELESEKEKITSTNQENSKEKMKKTCEHGQILMTINNLYLKVSKKENWSIVNPVKKNDETTPPLS